VNKLATSVVAGIVLSFPSLASAQHLMAAPAGPGILNSVETAAVRAIDSKEIEKRFARSDRSPLLMSLYGSLGALNALDIVTSRKAIARGGTEQNPLMKNAIGNNAGIAIKAASTLGTIYMIDRISKKSRKGAIVTAVVANSLAAIVVANNVGHGRRRSAS
jgi:hypothetical protein